MTGDTIPDGTLATRDDGRAVIRFERHLAHPVDEVWRALTTPEEMSSSRAGVSTSPG
jgi:hypothetical protein